jgi:excisionase family DNA binding protein
MKYKIIDILKIQGDKLKNIESQLSSTLKAVLNINEVCLLTELSKSHIYKLTCYRKIPFYKKSKHLFFDRVEIENWLRSARDDIIGDICTHSPSYVMTK